jgi:hypothetical protein
MNSNKNWRQRPVKPQKKCGKKIQINGNLECFISTKKINDFLSKK